MMPAADIVEQPRQGELADELRARISAGALIRCQEPMAKHTTLRVGGPADLYLEPASEADLAAALKWCHERQVRFFVVGRGSNLLVSDNGLRGVVICLAQEGFSRIEVEGTTLRCGAGARLKAVAVTARRHGLSGLEFLEGIPGSVGGALRMNAGAMAGATFDAVLTVRQMSFTGEVRELTPDQMSVHYRSCDDLKSHIALGALFRGKPDSVEAITQRMEAYSKKRWSSQPAAPSAGCAFKNPAEIPAGKLIDELGLKGTRVGGAVVSQEHGNFIINDRGATARDVLELIALLQAKVRAARGIELHTEIEILAG
jgi:UDP-N-acetylenolpyruvoylglucosamine reductase